MSKETASVASDFTTFVTNPMMSLALRLATAMITHANLEQRGELYQSALMGLLMETTGEAPHNDDPAPLIVLKSALCVTGARTLLLDTLKQLAAEDMAKQEHDSVKLAEVVGFYNELEKLVGDYYDGMAPVRAAAQMVQMQIKRGH